MMTYEKEEEENQNFQILCLPTMHQRARQESEAAAHGMGEGTCVSDTWEGLIPRKSEGLLQLNNKK